MSPAQEIGLDDDANAMPVGAAWPAVQDVTSENDDDATPAVADVPALPPEPANDVIVPFDEALRVLVRRDPVQQFVAT